MDSQYDFQSIVEEDIYETGDGPVEDEKPDIKILELKLGIDVCDEDGSVIQEKSKAKKQCQKIQQKRKNKSKYSNETAEQREERLQKIREQKRKRLEKETEEERQERLRKKREDQRRRVEKETEEHRQERLRKMREGQRRRLEKETEEQRQERLQKKREQSRRYLENEERLEKQRKNALERWRREQEKMQKYRQLPEESDEEYKKRLGILKEENPADFEKYMEKMERLKFWKLEYNIRRKLLPPEEKRQINQESRFRKYLKFIALPPEEQEKIKRKRLEYQRGYLKNLKGEKLERYKANIRKTQERHYKARTEKFKEYYKKRKMSETPEQRAKTLHYYKVNQAKRKLKLKLQKEGYSEDEIERRLKELHDQMWSIPLPPVVSAYKPRPRRKDSSNLDLSDSQSQSQSSTVSNSGAAVGHRTDFACLRTPLTSTSSSLRSTSEFSELGQIEKQYNYMYSVDDDDGCVYEDVEFNEDDQMNEEADLRRVNDEVDHDIPASVTSEVLHPPRNTTAISAPKSPNPKLEQEHFNNANALTSANVALWNEQSPPVAPVPSSTQLLNCKHCSESFSKDPDLRQHVKTSHPKHCWKCPKCDQVFLSAPDFSSHFQTHTKSSQNISNETRKCENSISIAKENSFERHSMKFSCVKCGTKFGTLELLKSHVKAMHPEAYFLCQNCDIIKYSSKSLEIHSKFCKKSKRKLGS